MCTNNRARLKLTNNKATERLAIDWAEAQNKAFLVSQHLHFTLTYKKMVIKCFPTKHSPLARRCMQASGTEGRQIRSTATDRLKASINMFLAAGWGKRVSPTAQPANRRPEIHPWQWKYFLIKALRISGRWMDVGKYHKIRFHIANFWRHSGERNVVNHRHQDMKPPRNPKRY